jgi:hypothetical protein
MSAVLLAVFREYEQAERVRTALVKDGFPTDRVELTANREPGQAALVPEGSRREKFAEYFRTLLSDADEQPRVAALTERVVRGAVTVTVHPRGSVETERATAMLEHAGADEVIGHDLGNQTFEQAASPGA